MITIDWQLVVNVMGGTMLGLAAYGITEDLFATIRHFMPSGRRKCDGPCCENYGTKAGGDQ